jgi:peptidyl-prolyl cis-trans isomerase D
MLQAIRDKVTGWIAYGIIFLISVPFALWGVNSYLGGGEVQPAATVNGEDISLRDLDQAYANYRQRLSQLFGGTIPESYASESMMREQVLGQLIEEIALRQYTQEQHYRIGDDELNRIIRNMNVFQRDEQFDTEIYQSQLRSLGYSPLGFEEELRRNNAMEQLQSGILATAFETPLLEKQFTSLNNQTRKIRSLTYSVDTASIQPGADEIEQLYLSQTDRYRTPEEVRIDFIELSLDSIKQNIEVDEGDVYARYQESKASYTSPEIRDTSHILITVHGDEEYDPALARITTIRERIVAGENFDDLARELSEDPGSASDGGSLGEVERGVMVQPFEAALYSMEVGQLSQPVKTSFGWHLIKLNSISGGETQSFETVKSTLEEGIRAELAEGQIYDLVENVANLVYEQSDSLQPAAEQFDLTIQTSDWFDRGSGSGIALEQKVRQIAFSADVLQQGLNSEAIELDNDRVVFIRLNQLKPAAVRPLDQVQELIKSEIITTKAREQSLKSGMAALAELKTGKTLDDLALEWSASISDHGFVERNQTGIDNAILGRSFSMSKPEQGPVFEGLSVASGNYAIIELSAVLSNDGNADRKALDGLVKTRGGAEYQAALKLLTNRAEVVRIPLQDLQDL